MSNGLTNKIVGYDETTNTIFSAPLLFPHSRPFYGWADTSGATGESTLPAEFAWGNAELLFEAGGEVGEGAETCHISYFRDVVFVLFEQLCGSVELVSLEEYARILARKTLYLVVELRS